MFDPKSSGKPHRFMGRFVIAIRAFFASLFHAEIAAQIAGIPNHDSDGAKASGAETTFWTDALVRQCRMLRDELAFLAPWSALPAAPSGFGDLVDIHEIPTLRELATLEAELLPPIQRRLQADTSPAVGAWLE